MNRGLKILEEAIYGEYKLLSEYRGNREKITVQCLKCGNIFESRPRYFKKENKNNTGKCKICNIDSRNKKEEFYKFMESRPEYEILTEYKTAKEDITVRHKDCGSVFTVPATHFTRGRNCLCMRHQSVKKPKEFIDYVKSTGEYSVIGKYINLHTKIKMKHNKCQKTYFVTPGKFKYGNRRCPHCKGSNGELTIQSYLDNNDIKYTREKTFDDLVYVNKLRMDFYIVYNNKKYCVEYHGEQHYEYCPWFHGTKDDFYERQEKDRIKKKYCEDNNIIYIEIPHYEFNNIEHILNEKVKNDK